MSYQPFPPDPGPGPGIGSSSGFSGAPAPTVQQPASAFSPSPPAVRARRTSLIGAGALVLVAGVVGGVVMMMAGSSNYDDGVKNLARAPIGCTTTLEFDRTGTFIVYVETEGAIGRRRGDCPGTDTDYRFRGDDLPDVDVDLVDDGGDRIDLDDDESTDYDADGSVGRSIASFQIDQPGDYEMTVSSNDDDFAIAVGKDPKASADSLKTIGLLTIGAGIVVGGVLILLGFRRTAPASASGPTGPTFATGPGGNSGGRPSLYSPPRPPGANQPGTDPPAAHSPPPPMFTPPTAPAPAPPPPTPPAGDPQWPAPPNR